MTAFIVGAACIAVGIGIAELILRIHTRNL